MTYIVLGSQEEGLYWEVGCYSEGCYSEVLLYFLCASAAVKNVCTFPPREVCFPQI